MSKQQAGMQVTAIWGLLGSQGGFRNAGGVVTGKIGIVRSAGTLSAIVDMLDGSGEVKIYRSNGRQITRGKEYVGVCSNVPRGAMPSTGDMLVLFCENVWVFHPEFRALERCIHAELEARRQEVQQQKQARKQLPVFEPGSVRGVSIEMKLAVLLPIIREMRLPGWLQEMFEENLSSLPPQIVSVLEESGYLSLWQKGKALEAESA